MTNKEDNEMVIPKGYYECAECGGIFKYGRTMKEAIAEKEQNFPDVPLEKCVLVCCVCYKKLMASINKT